MQRELGRFFQALRPVQYLVNALLVILLVLPVELLLYGTGVELLDRHGAVLSGDPRLRSSVIYRPAWRAPAIDRSGVCGGVL